MTCQTSSNGLSPAYQRQGRNQAKGKVSTASFWTISLQRSLPLFCWWIMSPAPSDQIGFAPCDHAYHNFKGTNLSKSCGAFVEVPYFLERYDPDALRKPLVKKLDESVIEDEYALPAG